MKTFGKSFWKNGIEYLHTMPWWKRPIAKISCSIQWLLWKVGVSIHNPITNECTPDFSCCRGK